jgi:hypothetical protein
MLRHMDAAAAMCEMLHVALDKLQLHRRDTEVWATEKAQTRDLHAEAYRLYNEKNI